MKVSLLSLYYMEYKYNPKISVARVARIHPLNE